jgi:hypothetical protein
MDKRLVAGTVSVLIGAGAVGCTAEATGPGEHTGEAEQAYASDCPFGAVADNTFKADRAAAQAVLNGILSGDVSHIPTGTTTAAQSACSALKSSIQSLHGLLGNGCAVMQYLGISSNRLAAPGSQSCTPVSTYQVIDKGCFPGQYNDLHSNFEGISDQVDNCYKGTYGSSAYSYASSFVDLGVVAGGNYMNGVAVIPPYTTTNGIGRYGLILDPGGVTLTQTLSSSPAGASASATDVGGNAAKAYQWPSTCRSNTAASGAPPFIGAEYSSSVALSAGSTTSHQIVLGSVGGCFSGQAKSL